MLDIEPYIYPLLSLDMQQSQSQKATAEHLADLFETHLNLSEDIATAHTHSQPPVPTSNPANQGSTQQPADSAQSRYNMSQHYHHSAHISATSPTLISTPLTPTASLHPLQPHRDNHVLRELIQNDIPPSSLLRSQLTLFETCNSDQRQKLIMLWRLAPPTYAQHGGQELVDRLGEYQHITLEQEEELTWLRYQRNFARTANVRETVLAEQLCGKKSLLEEYVDADGTVGTRESPSQMQDGDGDEAML